jgi:hypothetical protein
MVLVMTQLLTIKNRISSVIIGGVGVDASYMLAALFFFVLIWVATGSWQVRGLGRWGAPLRDHLLQGPPVTRNAEID